MMSGGANVLGRCKANEYYKRAIESPDLMDAIALRDKAQAAQRALLADVSRPPQPDSADVDLDLWLEQVVAAEAAEPALQAQRVALSSLVVACDSRIASAAAYPDAILSRLNGDVDALMGEVAEVVSRLDGARCVSEVIALDVSAIWKELLPLRKSYDEIRKAQEWALLGRTTLIDARSQHVDDDHASDAMIANLDSFWPQWNSPDRTIRLQGAAPRRQPWPEDPIEMLVWLADSAAEPWIPTIKELERLRADRRRRLNPPDGKRRVDAGWSPRSDPFADDESAAVAIDFEESDV